MSTLGGTTTKLETSIWHAIEMLALLWRTPSPPARIVDARVQDLTIVAGGGADLEVVGARSTRS